jgi:hypothetical protein
MSLEDEQDFLAAWKIINEQGEMVVLPPLRQTLERKLGKAVKPPMVYRLLQRHRWRKVARDTCQLKAGRSNTGRMGKNTLEELAALLTAGAVTRASHSSDFSRGSPIWRDGQNSQILGSRPVADDSVGNGYERGVTYVYGSISLLHGQLDWSLREKMNKDQTNAFLDQVSKAQPVDFFIIRWEIPRLCRGGSQGLTMPGVCSGAVDISSLRNLSSPGFTIRTVLHLLSGVGRFVLGSR